MAKKKEIIKVGFCVAYDWELLKKSVPRVYAEADVICFSLDKNRRAWSGTKFDFDESAFFSWLREIDKDNKIRLYEDDFSLADLSPIQNDNRQRLLMSQFLGPGGWHIQIDADEYFFDFRSFTDYLLKLNTCPTGKEKPINICCNWISLIKSVGSGYLFVHNKANQYETMPFATNVPEYLNARHNSHFNHISPFFVLHETWARGESQLLQKINSWGHDADFVSKKSYFNLWKALDEYNYRYIFNLHPLNATTWQRLGFVPETEVGTIISWLEKNNILQLDKKFLRIKNSRVVQSVKQRLK